MMTTGSPEISIIVPIYNVEGYIKCCLDSLINQTYYNVEIICVDDGSTDGSASILADYASRDPRIITLRQENAGLAAARNKGISAVRSPYVMFCDSDDWYEPTACEKMLAAIESAEDVDMAVCAVKLHYEYAARMRHKDECYYRLKYNGIVSVDDNLLLRSDVSACNKIFRSSVLREKGIRFPTGLHYEDTSFFHCYGLCCRRAVFVNEKLYHYRRREGSIMSNTFDGISRRASDMLRVAESIHSFMTAQSLLPARTRYYGRLFFDLLTSALGFAHRPEDKFSLLDRADDYLTRIGLTFKGDPSLTYRRGLLTRRILPGTTRRRLFGLLTTKYKPHHAKHYLLGLPLCTTHTLPA